MNRFLNGKAKSATGNSHSENRPYQDILLVGRYAQGELPASVFHQHLTDLSSRRVYICAVEDKASVAEYPDSVKFILNTDHPDAFASVSAAISRDKQNGYVVILPDENLKFSMFRPHIDQIRKSQQVIIAGLTGNIGNDVSGLADAVVVSSPYLPTESDSVSDGVTGRRLQPRFSKVLKALNLGIRFTKPFGFTGVESKQEAGHKPCRNDIIKSLAEQLLAKIDELRRMRQEKTMKNEAITA